MKKALIDAQIKVGKDNLGVRISQVEDDEFPVASPCYWVDCPDHIEADKYYYLESDGSFHKNPNATHKVADLHTDPETLLSEDADGNKTQQWVWNWDTEAWDKEDI